MFVFVYVFMFVPHFEIVLSVSGSVLGIGLWFVASVVGIEEYS